MGKKRNTNRTKMIREYMRTHNVRWAQAERETRPTSRDTHPNFVIGATGTGKTIMPTLSIDPNRSGFGITTTAVDAYQAEFPHLTYEQAAIGAYLRACWTNNDPAHERAFDSAPPAEHYVKVTRRHADDDCTGTIICATPWLCHGYVECHHYGLGARGDEKVVEWVTQQIPVYEATGASVEEVARRTDELFVSQEAALAAVIDEDGVPIGDDTLDLHGEVHTLNHSGWWTVPFDGGCIVAYDEQAQDWAQEIADERGEGMWRVEVDWDENGAALFVTGPAERPIAPVIRWYPKEDWWDGGSRPRKWGMLARMPEVVEFDLSNGGPGLFDPLKVVSSFVSGGGEDREDAAEGEGGGVGGSV